MKIALILLNILILLIPVAVRALRKINQARLFTLVMLLLYSIGIIKLAFRFPIPCLSLLGLALLTVLTIAFRQRFIRHGVDRADVNMHLMNRRGTDAGPANLQRRII